MSDRNVHKLLEAHSGALSSRGGQASIAVADRWALIKRLLRTCGPAGAQVDHFVTTSIRRRGVRLACVHRRSAVMTSLC